MYRPNAPQVLLKKAVIRTVPGQAPGNETSFRLKNGPQPARRRQSVTVSPMYGLFSAEAAENFALNKKCIKFARCLKRRKLHTVDVAQLVRASDCGSEGRGFEPHLPPEKAFFGRPFFYYKIQIITHLSFRVHPEKGKCTEVLPRHRDPKQVSAIPE